MPRVGALDKRLVLERPVDTADGAGGGTTVWTPWATVWAAVSTGAGREFWAQKALVPELTHVVTIRYRTGVTPAMRVVWGARVFSILAAPDMAESREWLTLNCAEQAQVT